MEDARNSLCISVQDEKVTQKLIHWQVPLFHASQSYELASSRMKRVGMKVIVVSHIFKPC